MPQGGGDGLCVFGWRARVQRGAGYVVAGVSSRAGTALARLMGACRFDLEMQMGRLLGQHEDTVSQVVFSWAASESACACSGTVLC